jgi:hypothetical protein
MSVNTKGNKRDNQAVEETGTECLQLLKKLRELHKDTYHGRKILWIVM